MTILVTGATGAVGRNVVVNLVEAGENVRAVTRTPDAAALPPSVEVRAGDLAMPESLSEPLRGASALYLFPFADTARAVVNLAVQQGVRRIVVLSSGAVTGGFDTDFHLPVEEAVRESGLEWTFVRPGEFAANRLHLWGPSVRAERIVRDPFPDAPSYPVHERDVADVATASLLEDGHGGAAYTFDGPDRVTHREQVEIIAGALGEEIRFERVTPHEARDLYRAQGGFAAENADMLLGFTTYAGDEAADPDKWVEAKEQILADQPQDNTSRQATGRPARTFARWAQDHVEDWR